MLKLTLPFFPDRITIFPAMNGNFVETVKLGTIFAFSLIDKRIVVCNSTSTKCSLPWPHGRFSPSTEKPLKEHV